MNQFQLIQLLVMEQILLAMLAAAPFWDVASTLTEGGSPSVRNWAILSVVVAFYLAAQAVTYAMLSNMKGGK